MDRLNKYLAHAGVGSRRQCDALIVAGRVAVNGVRVDAPGVRINPETDKVAVDDNPVNVERKVYWVFHKPRGVLCTNYDPSGRTKVLDFLEHVDQRVYTVGRLDLDSEGLLLMTNDGELANQLMHPRFGIEKTYMVQVAGFPSPDDQKKLLEGVYLAEGKVKAKNVKRMKVQGQSTWLRITLNEGKNREIRRMLAKLGHRSCACGGLPSAQSSLDRLPAGKSRKLSKAEHDSLLKSIRKRKPAEQSHDELSLTPT